GTGTSIVFLHTPRLSPASLQQTSIWIAAVSLLLILLQGVLPATATPWQPHLARAPPHAHPLPQPPRLLTLIAWPPLPGPVGASGVAAVLPAPRLREEAVLSPTPPPPAAALPPASPPAVSKDRAWEVKLTKPCVGPAQLRREYGHVLRGEAPDDKCEKARARGHVVCPI